MLTPGTVVTVTPEKPVAGGRMLARHEGLIVLVAGAIPGEPVRARIERTGPSVVFASVTDVIEAHPDRRAVAFDPRCGGAAWAHIAYPAQVALKADLLHDALVRTARIAWDEPIAVAASPQRGYRMRARLHARRGRPGFFLEGTHTVCDAAVTGQLSSTTTESLDALGAALARLDLDTHADIDVSENIAADMRGIHVTFGGRVDGRAASSIPEVPLVTGLSWSDAARPREHVVWGTPWVEERLVVAEKAVALRRHVRAFFQGNRYLLPSLVTRVHALCPDGPVLDLYAGAGLFAVTLAAAGRSGVTAVEGDALAAADLHINAQRVGGGVDVRACSVERFVTTGPRRAPLTLLLDPPRTGMTREAAAAAVGLGAARVVFVSCDVATFARDVRRFVDGGYRLTSVDALDLFPETSHVEAIGVLERA